MIIIEVAGKKLQFSKNGNGMGRTWKTFHSEEVQAVLREVEEFVAGGSNMIIPSTIYETPTGEQVCVVPPTWTTDGEIYLRQ